MEQLNPVNVFNFAEKKLNNYIEYIYNELNESKTNEKLFFTKIQEAALILQYPQEKKVKIEISAEPVENKDFPLDNPVYLKYLSTAVDCIITVYNSIIDSNRIILSVDPENVSPEQTRYEEIEKKTTPKFNEIMSTIILRPGEQKNIIVPKLISKLNSDILLLEKSKDFAEKTVSEKREYINNFVLNSIASNPAEYSKIKVKTQKKVNLLKPLYIKMTKV